MLKHIVMWKLKDFAEGRSKAENAQKVKFLLDGLKKQIKQIKTLEAGINADNSADAYDIVLYTEFSNAENFNIYQNHPEHMKVGEFVGKVRLERKVVDYET
jgi:hypothetical protein